MVNHTYHQFKVGDLVRFKSSSAGLSNSEQLIYQTLKPTFSRTMQAYKVALVLLDKARRAIELEFEGMSGRLYSSYLFEPALKEACLFNIGDQVRLKTTSQGLTNQQEGVYKKILQNQNLLLHGIYRVTNINEDEQTLYLDGAKDSSYSYWLFENITQPNNHNKSTGLQFPKDPQQRKADLKRVMDYMMSSPESYYSLLKQADVFEL